MCDKIKVDILGTEYTVSIGVSLADDKSLEGRYGYCQPTARSIVIVDMNEVPQWAGEDEKCKEATIEVTLRHEVIHAFLAESGLWGCSMDVESWAMNEEMIDWIAMQFPKILKVFETLGCTGGTS